MIDIMSDNAKSAHIWGGENVQIIRRVVIGNFILALGIAFPSLLLSQDNMPEIVKLVKPSSVVIFAYDIRGNILSQGSGFFVNREGDVITNRHVLQGAIKAEIKTISGDTYPVKQVVAEDNEADIIRLSVDIPIGLAAPLRISSFLPVEGERILVIGSPLGLEQSISDGIVSAIREIPGYGKVIQITAPISPGSSGSPVVNIKGEVVGIATFLAREGQSLNFAIPQERVLKLSIGNRIDFSEWSEKLSADLDASSKESCARGLVYMKREDYEKALASFEEAIKNNPSYFGAYYFISLCEYILERYQRALEAIKQAIRIKPDLEMQYLMLGDTYRALERYLEAQEAYKRAIHLKPAYAEAYRGLGDSYKGQERYLDALEAYKQAININPDYAEANLDLADIYFLLGYYQEAAELLKKIIRIMPKNAEAYWSLGGSYYALGLHHNAEEALKQAIRIKPDYARARFSLCLVYLRLEDKASAMNEYEILKKLDATLARKLFDLIYR